jgi:hypothetical protein
MLLLLSQQRLLHTLRLRALSTAKEPAAMTDVLDVCNAAAVVSHKYAAISMFLKQDHHHQQQSACACYSSCSMLAS